MKFDASAIKFPTSVSVTEQSIDISNLTQIQKKFYVELFDTIVRRYEEGRKPRFIIGLAGPSGSGKSVIGAILLCIAKQVAPPFRFEVLGIDAFHFPNEYLLSKKVGEKNLKDYKGRFDTYDVPKLGTVLKDFSAGGEVVLPQYSRKTHDPIKKAVVLTERDVLLFVEGLWLLYDESGWEQVGAYLDFKLFVDADAHAVRDNVIRRHMAGGRNPENAANYYDAVDAAHSDIVAATAKRADLIIPSFYKI
jgi:pantothenate kinase